MVYMTARVNLLAMALAMTTVVCAQEPELKVKPSGRILFDAAYINSSHQEDELKSGVGIPDMRVGVGFTYDKWKGKIDMGYAYGKVNMKDVWLQYDFDKQNFVRGGYFIHQYRLPECHQLIVQGDDGGASEQCRVQQRPNDWSYV